LWTWFKVESGACRTIDRTPISVLQVYLGKPLVAGKQEQIVEVGKEPGLGLGAARPVWAVAGEVKAAPAAMDDRPVAACAAFSLAKR
jgi:hypothetical protein